MSNLTNAEQIVYDRIATVLNYNNGKGHEHISLNALTVDYGDIGNTHLVDDYKNLGYSNLPALLRKFNIHVTPSGMVKTLIPGRAETGAAGVIKLMQKTSDNPKPNYGFANNKSRQPRISQSSFTGDLNYPSTSRPGRHIPQWFPRPFPLPLNKVSLPQPSVDWAEYYALPVAHRSSSEVFLPSTQFRPPRNQHPVPQLPTRRRNSLYNRREPSSEISTSPIKPDMTFSSSNYQNVSNKNQYVPAGVNSFLTSRPVPRGISSESLNTDTSSSGNKPCDFNPKEHDLPQFIVKAVIFDPSRYQWKVALKRPPTEADANFFKFCAMANYAIDGFPVIPREDLTAGTCYLVKYIDKYYRGVYLAPSRDNTHGIFDFADFEAVRPISFEHIREFPKVDVIRLPFMVTWVHADVCNAKVNDRVYCLFSPKFEETCFRKIHQAQLQKIEN